MRRSAHDDASPALRLLVPPPAFTLIELMMVIIIMGGMMTIVVVNLDWILPAARIGATARKIAGMLELARNEAKVNGLLYGVVYDLDENEYWLLAPSEEDSMAWEANTDYDYDEEDRRFRVMVTELPDDIEFVDVQLWGASPAEDGQVKIDFTPMGTASGHIVRLHSTRTGQDLALELNPLTATVTMYEGEYEFDGVIEYRD